MPLEMSWSIALHLVLDGFFLGLGWILAQAVYNAILWLLAKARG